MADRSYQYHAPEVQDGQLVAVVGADAERRHVAHLHRQHRLELLGRVHLQDPGRKGLEMSSEELWYFTLRSFVPKKA